MAILGYLDHSIDEWDSNENSYSHREGAFILEAKIRKLFQSRKSTKEQATEAKTETNNKYYSLEKFSAPDKAQSREINSIRHRIWNFILMDPNSGQSIREGHFCLSPDCPEGCFEKYQESLDSIIEQEAASKSQEV